MTGLIYIVIIALWVAVLVPMWLRRHDQISEVRSTARFSRSMKSLAAMEVHPAGSARGHRSLGESGARPVAARSAHQSAARRRAIVLAGLSATLALTLILAIASVAPVWVPLIPARLVVAFMGATAMTAPARAAAPRARREPVRRPAPVPVVEQTPAQQDDDEWLNWNAWDEDDDSWEAVPTTLPTYVSAPKASAVPRPIDKVRPGAWTGSAMVDAARAMRRRVAESASHDEVDHGAATAEIPVVRANPALAVNE